MTLLHSNAWLYYTLHDFITLYQFLQIYGNFIELNPELPETRKNKAVHESEVMRDSESSPELRETGQTLRETTERVGNGIRTHGRHEAHKGFRAGKLTSSNSFSQNSIVFGPSRNRCSVRTLLFQSELYCSSQNSIVFLQHDKPTQLGLFNGHALRKVSGLVHVQTADRGNVICQQL